MGLSSVVKYQSKCRIRDTSIDLTLSACLPSSIPLAKDRLGLINVETRSLESWNFHFVLKDQIHQEDVR
jgi:hypothetical protein